MGKLEAASRTGDDVFQQSVLGGTTNASQELSGFKSRHNSMRKSDPAVNLLSNQLWPSSKYKACARF